MIYHMYLTYFKIKTHFFAIFLGLIGHILWFENLYFKKRKLKPPLLQSGGLPTKAPYEKVAVFYFYTLSPWAPNGSKKSPWAPNGSDNSPCAPIDSDNSPKRGFYLPPIHPKLPPSYPKILPSYPKLFPCYPKLPKSLSWIFHEEQSWSGIVKMIFWWFELPYVL